MVSLPATITREGAREDLELIQKVFDSFNVPIFLTYGALLGIYRDGDFIQYDDDIDLCVTAKIDYKTRKDIGWALTNLGFLPQVFREEGEELFMSFNVFGRMETAETGYNGDGETGIITCQRKIRTTIFFFKDELCPIHGRDMTCFPKYGSVRLIFTPAHFFDKPDTIKFKGKKYLTPSPIKDYLKFMYGDDWKKPIKGKHAPQWGQGHPGMANSTNL